MAFSFGVFFCFSVGCFVLKKKNFWPLAREDEMLCEQQQSDD